MRQIEQCQRSGVHYIMKGRWLTNEKQRTSFPAAEALGKLRVESVTPSERASAPTTPDDFLQHVMSSSFRDFALV